MRILHLSQKTGDQRALRACYTLAKLGHENTVVMGLDYDPRCPGFRPMHEWCGPAECVVRTQLSARLSSSQRGKLIASLKADVIVMHEPLTMQSYADLPDVPIILDSHELNIAMPMQWDSPRRKEARDTVLRRIMTDPRIVAHLIPSEDLVLELQREMRYTVDKWDVPTFAIHNGLPTPSEGWRPRTDDCREWMMRGSDRDGPLIEADEKLVVFCGNLTGDRRPDLLIAVMAELQRRDQRWTAMVLSRADMIENHVIAPLGALGTLFMDPVPYPWPWNIDGPDPHLVDVLSVARVGFSFAEVEHASWRGASPNKAHEYSAAGTYQLCNQATWLSRALGSAGESIADNPRVIADRIEQLDSARPSYESVSAFARRFACDGPVDLPHWQAALECV